MTRSKWVIRWISPQWRPSASSPKIVWKYPRRYRTWRGRTRAYRRISPRLSTMRHGPSAEKRIRILPWTVNATSPWSTLANWKVVKRARNRIPRTRIVKTAATAESRAAPQKLRGWAIMCNLVPFPQRNIAINICKIFIRLIKKLNHTKKLRNLKFMFRIFPFRFLSMVKCTLCTDEDC